MADPVLLRCLAEVATDSLVPLARAIVRICQALEADLGARGSWLAGSPPTRPLILDGGLVEQHLRQVERAQAEAKGEPFVLTAGTGAGAVTLAAQAEPTPAGSVATVWFSIPDGEDALAQVPGLTRALAELLGAAHAHVEHSQLLIRYQLRRALERSRANVPPHLWQYLVEPEPIPEELVVPDLLVPQEYDRLRVPAGIWWVNVWGPAQVATLTDARIRAAPWAAIDDGADGSLVLRATREPLDPDDPAHVARLRALISALGLREAQERARFA